jgi:hypothetical protein
LPENALLQVWQAPTSVGFASEKQNYGTASFVVGGIEPVPEIEFVVRMGFISRLVLEEVDWDGDVVRRV